MKHLRIYLLAFLALAFSVAAPAQTGKVKPKSKHVQAKEQTVYGTKTGSKYHTAGCSYLRRSSIPMKLSEAKAKGLTACSRCGPPR